MCAKLLQSYLTLCDSLDYSPSSSSVLEIFLARILVWLPCLPPGDLPNSGLKPMSPASAALQAFSLPTEPPGKPRLAKENIK